MIRAPFRIEELKIRNFRGIDELDLRFEVPYPEDPGGFVVLAGDNGTGKTAVLEAILLVLGRLDLWPADAAPLEEQVRFGAPDFQIEATLRYADGRTDRMSANRRSVMLSPDAVKRGWDQGVGVRRGDFHAEVEYFSARREPEALGEAPGGEGEHEREAHRILELKRRLRNAYIHSLRARTNGALPEASPFTKLERFVQRFLGEDVHLDIVPASNNPGSEFEVVTRKTELPVDITSIAMARAAALEGKVVPTVVPIDRLSSGEVSLFAFAGPLIFRDTAADVVLIDEPEQHLHMGWHRSLIDALRELSPQSQLIVATHSMDVIESALSYEGHLLLHEGDPRAKLAAE